MLRSSGSPTQANRGLERGTRDETPLFRCHPERSAAESRDLQFAGAAIRWALRGFASRQDPSAPIRDLRRWKIVAARTAGPSTAFSAFGGSLRSGCHAEERSTPCLSPRVRRGGSDLQFLHIAQSPSFN